MLSILKHSHSGLRWLALAFLVASIIKAFSGWKKNKSYTDSQRKFNLISMTIIHIQLLVGLGLYFLNWGSKVSFAGMKDPMIRFFTVEHLLMMIVSITLITLGYSKSKRNPKSGFKTIFIFYTIGLLLILAGIPWPFRTTLGAAWF